MSNLSRPCLTFLRPARVATVVLALATISSAHATLLVYEGFNGYTLGALAGQTPNTNTIGLDRTVGYYDGPALFRTANYTLQSSSLSFAGLQTSGGSLNFSAGTNVIGADIDIATPFTGTLWSSYLVRLSTKSTGLSGDGATIRIGTTPSDSSTTNHFNSWADSRSSSTNVAVGYGSTGTNGTGTLALNTTYIVINRFTNVGNASGGTATLWALTVAQYNTFRLNGGDEAALGGTTVTATASNTLTGTFVFSSTQAVGIVTVNDAGAYDELRFGSTLADVTPIPEPATSAALLGLACGLVLAARRRLHRNRRD
ncbi:MAG: anchor protein [Rariglobus sp.]|nr:anchor protein [Rariglobus sp.]